MDDLLDIHNGAEPPGDRPGFSCELPFGYRVVFTLEKQNIGKVRHLSISVSIPGNLPSMTAVEAIMHEIGFDNKLLKCMIDFEDIGENHQAINVLEICK